MGPDENKDRKDIETLINQEIVEIPVVFITMREGEYLNAFLSDQSRAYIGMKIHCVLIFHG